MTNVVTARKNGYHVDMTKKLEEEYEPLNLGSRAFGYTAVSNFVF